MIDHVDQTLTAWRKTGFRWGETDCALSVVRYANEACGAGAEQLARHFGAYATEQEADDIRAEGGGLVAMFDAIGLPRTDDPARGDIVLCQAIGGDIIAGLCTGDGVAIRRERGVAEIGKRFVRIVAAWKVN